MILKGKYNSAIVYTNNVEEKAQEQIIELCNQEFAKDSKIRIMPDVHAGAGCVIGTTMTIQDKVVPNLVGVDIGCGMEVVKFTSDNFCLEKLDKVIKEYVPSGFSVRKEVHPCFEFIDLTKLKCYKHINAERAALSIGTLGGGNHFVEINQDSEGYYYLVIHTGSRNLGKQVAEYYQKLGYDELSNSNDEKKNIIERCKREGRQVDIESEIAKIDKKKFTKDLAWVEGENLKNYLHDMKIVQGYASLNRYAIVSSILDNFLTEENNFKFAGEFETIHNYIDTEAMILRKGAVAAARGIKFIVPMNMRDGSLICVGKGNPEWNYSAPHGAGRLMGRGQARRELSLEEYTKSMQDVYTTSVVQATLDEAPLAYKPMQEIIDNIGDTAEVVEIIKPIYNFKNSNEGKNR